MSTPLTSIIREDAARIAQMIDLSPLEGKRVIITGATGLIGTYLTAVLEEGVRNGLDTRVVLAARSFPPKASWDIGQSFIRDSVDLTNDISHLPIADVIFHVAGYGQPAKFIADGMKTLKLNTATLCQLIERHLAEKGTLLYTSSSEIYSGCRELPYKEVSIGTTNPQHPRACYIEAKRCGEAICGYANGERSDTRINCISARVALAYGPGTLPGDSRVINQFIQAALVNKRINLLDTGQACRTYCYISDTVEMLLHAALYGKYTVYNVGGRSCTDIRSLALMIGRMTGAEVYIPPDAAQNSTLASAPEKVEMDVQRITAEAHKDHFVSLQDGLTRTISYQKLLYA